MGIHLYDWVMDDAATETTIEIEATHPTVNCGYADVDIDITIGGVTTSDGVTLARDHTGTWTSWGSRDHWCGSELLDAVDRAERAGKIDDARQLLDEIVAYASEAAESLDD